MAFNKREITVFGFAAQAKYSYRWYCSTYIKVLELKKVVEGQIFNAGYENKGVNDLANLVRSVIGKDVSENKILMIIGLITSEKIKNVLGWKQKKYEEFYRGFKQGFLENKYYNSLENEMYFNIKRMKSINLKWVRYSYLP